MRTPRCVVAFVSSLLISVSMASADVVEYEHAANQWMADVGTFEARAFDEFVPGIINLACLVQPPSSTSQLQLSAGTIVVSAHDANGALVCPLFDGTSSGWATDGYMVGPGLFGPNTPYTLSLEFDPPILAFYSYYGSLEVNHQVEMQLFDADDNLITSLDGPLGPKDGIGAIGHGFVSDVPVGRITFATSDEGETLLGAFAWLAPNEESLGEVIIPGYAGPNGENVALDFAVAWNVAPVCNADANVDGVVNVADLLIVLGFWGASPPPYKPADINGDGTVGTPDLLAVINHWGPCP